MNSNWFKLVMKMTKVEYGKNLLLKGVPIIFNKGGAKLKIGENVTIKSSFLSNLVGLYSRTIVVTRAPGAAIEIGDNVGISGATIYARKKITIGENTCIGGNCKILDNDFHPIEAEVRNKLLRDENGGDSNQVPSREIKIGRNCFIGCNSIILKGTVLAERRHWFCSERSPSGLCWIRYSLQIPICRSFVQDRCCLSRWVYC